MDYYKILNVSTKADDKTIKKAYRLLAKKYHPDTYQGDKSYAEGKMQEINEAYDTLSNADLRKEYDKSIGLYKEAKTTSSSTYNSRQTTNSNTNSYNNVRYRPNNANTYYDSYGYAETNYSTYTGDRYTRNRYKERTELERKEIAIKITILLVVACIILIALISMMINSVSEIFSPMSRGSNKNIRENGYYEDNTNKPNYTIKSSPKPNYTEKVSPNATSNNINAGSTNNIIEDAESLNQSRAEAEATLKAINAIKGWIAELEKIEIDEEEVEGNLNELLGEIKKYTEENPN